MRVPNNVSAAVLATSLLSFATTLVVSKPANPPQVVEAYIPAKKAVRLPLCNNRKFEDGQTKQVCVALADILLLALVESSKAQSLK